MIDDKCKKCRRVGEKLFLKGEKCFTPKCPLSRKPYAPGTSGGVKTRKRKKAVSEYGIQLKEKQKTKFSYGLREKQFSNYVDEAKRTGKGDSSIKLFEILESRLDNAVFRMGFGESRTIARQIVSHGHMMVNGRRVTIPSYRLKIGDKISVRPQSAEKQVFKDFEVKNKKYNPPAWIKFDKSKKEGEIIGKPSI